MKQNLIFAMVVPIKKMQSIKLLLGRAIAVNNKNLFLGGM